MQPVPGGGDGGDFGVGKKPANRIEVLGQDVVGAFAANEQRGSRVGLEPGRRRKPDEG